MLTSYLDFDHFDAQLMREQVQAMRDNLDAISTGGIPDSTDFEADVTGYIASLLQGQVPSGAEHRLLQGAWALFPGVIADSDATTEFAVLPTFIALATLTQYLFAQKTNLHRQLDCVLAIQRGLDFVAPTRFKGNGYEGEAQGLDYLSLFIQGRLPELLHFNPDFHPKASAAFEQAIARIKTRLAEGNTKGGWNSDYRSEYEAVIAQYQQAKNTYNSDAVPSLSFDAP